MGKKRERNWEAFFRFTLRRQNQKKWKRKNSQMRLYIKRADTSIFFDPDASGPVSLMVGDTIIRGEYKTESSLSVSLISSSLRTEAGIQKMGQREYRLFIYQKQNHTSLRHIWQCTPNRPCKGSNTWQYRRGKRTWSFSHPLLNSRSVPWHRTHHRQKRHITWCLERWWEKMSFSPPPFLPI